MFLHEFCSGNVIAELHRSCWRQTVRLGGLNNAWFVKIELRFLRVDDL